ncbi:hypothetical protein ACIQGZ_16930 [Streptomyces sp. NPDC092296]|uniref:hypothetical protein n=1 Tax=Streptomyces sp. NPDC092296 TaxID=3366012 RepID=UPI00381652DD
MLLSGLADPFDSPILNASLWGATTTGVVAIDTVNNRANLACPTAAGAVSTLGTAAVWDGRGGSVSAQVIPVPRGSGGTLTRLAVAKDASNRAAIRLTGGHTMFELAVTTGGSTVTAALAAYDPSVHRWWRLREQSGRWWADTSPDGWTWTAQTSLAYTWPAAAVALLVEAGTTAAETYTGLVAAVAHVNTMAGGLNPAWPLMQHALGVSSPGGGGGIPPGSLVDLAHLTRGEVETNRGRQYETDDVRTGEAAEQWANQDGAFDPENAAGPWFGALDLYQPFVMRAQWPATPNLLAQGPATGGDLGGYAVGTRTAAMGVSCNTDAAQGEAGDGVVVATAGAWQGGRALQFAVSSGEDDYICYTLSPNLRPGVPCTVQMRVRNITPGTSLKVQGLYADSSSGETRGAAVILTGSATAPWTPVTVTATVDPGARLFWVGVATAAPAAAACTVQVDGWQVEHADRATPWVCPGEWTPLYSGFTERLPQTWTMGGTYGLVSPEMVDAFALLSQQDLRDVLIEEVAAHEPAWLYPLSDPEGSDRFADWTGNFPPVQPANPKAGPGSLTSGTAITATDPVKGVYLGSAGTVVTVANPNPGTATAGPATVLGLSQAGIKGPASRLFTRMIAFRYTAGSKPAARSYVWSAMDQRHMEEGPSGSQCHLWIDSSGHLNWSAGTPEGTGTLATLSSAINVSDGNWHLAMFGRDASGHGTTCLDGNVLTWSVSALAATGIVGDHIGGWLDITTVGGSSKWNFQGDIAFACEFPDLLTADAMRAISTAWRSACAGESSGARYARILRYAGYTGASAVDAGVTTNMAPAAFGGQDALSALQDVVATESGVHFISRGGAATFLARSRRYNSTVPTVTFGEDTANGEYPYETVALDYDPTRLANTVTVTQEATGQAFAAIDGDSVDQYGTRTMDRSSGSADPLECQDQAKYLLSRYKRPARRISSIVLNPSSHPALWPVCLALEIGTRVRVMRRPNGAPPILVDCFVDGLSWEMDDAASARLTLQCSPADLTPYAVFGAWRTTVRTAVASGATTVTVNASADNANPLAAQLGQGQRLVLGLGTANQEIVTVDKVSATTSGWTSAVITLTIATTRSHAVGDLLCEPLPAGVTDPSVYDSASAFDAVAFAY